VSNRRTLMAAAAIVLALVAGIGVYMYAAGADKRAQDNASFVNAYVATADIAKGTTGAEVLQAGLVDQEKVAKGSLPPAAITSLDELNGKVLAGPLNAQQFITAGTFVSEEDGLGSAFANQIKTEDLVAVTVTVDADRGVANQIAPGDHVNIAAKSSETPDGTAPQYSYILDHVKVLAVGASVAAQQATAAAPADDPSGAAAPPTNSGVLTFEVTKDQALQIINANQGGSQIYLVLLAPDQPAPTSGAAKAAASSK
jgi:pilus assembly protein CpaB